MSGLTSASVSLSATDQSILSEAVVALGRRLTKELDLDSGNDTLGKWMAHHIAGLMRKAKTVTGAEKNVVEGQCADTILKLWSHRASFQSGRRPLGSFEPIFLMLAKMSDERKRFYFSEPSTEDNEWLRMAEATDDVARKIITFSLAMASEKASSQEKDWLQLATQLKIETDMELILITKLLQGDPGSDAEQNDKKGTEKLRQFQDGLSKFCKIINQMDQAIEKRLSQDSGIKSHRKKRRRTK